MACTTTHTESTGSDRQGIAELHVDARSLIGSDVTRVTVDTGGQITDLTRNAVTGTFDAELLLTAGTQTLTARAFGRTCTTTLHATTLEGAVTDAAANRQLF